LGNSIRNERFLWTSTANQAKEWQDQKNRSASDPKTKAKSAPIVAWKVVGVVKPQSETNAGKEDGIDGPDRWSVLAEEHRRALTVTDFRDPSAPRAAEQRGKHAADESAHYWP